jgi:hypothetical protein
VRAAALLPLSLSLTSRPHLPAALSRALPPTGRPAPPVSRFVVLLAYDSPSSPPSPSPRRTGKFGTAHPRRLTVYSPGTAPRREVSLSPLCGINAGAMHLTGARRAPPLPFPRAPIKRSLRAPPSPHQPQPPLSSLARAQFAEAPPSSSSPVSRPPLLPSPLLVQRAIRLAYQLHHIVVNSERYFPHPNPSHEAHRRRLLPRSSATSPRTAPSRTPLAKLSPPLGSPDPPHAKATTHCPRTGPPAANHRRAHRRPFFSPRTAGSPHRQPVAPFPPSALAGEWARGDDVIPSHAHAVTRLGPQLGRRPRARARCA